MSSFGCGPDMPTVAINDFEAALPDDPAAVRTDDFELTLTATDPLRTYRVQVRGRGQAIGQIHERDGQLISYFGGHLRGEQATFSFGVVDLDLPDPLDVWRQDGLPANVPMMNTESNVTYGNAQQMAVHIWITDC